MAVDWLTKGAHRQCLCDLKARHNIHSLTSNHLPSSLHGAEAGSRALLDRLGTHFMSWAALNSHIPASAVKLYAPMYVQQVIMTAAGSLLSVHVITHPA